MVKGMDEITDLKSLDLGKNVVEEEEVGEGKGQGKCGETKGFVRVRRRRMEICSDSPPAKGHEVRVGAQERDLENSLGLNFGRHVGEGSIRKVLLYIFFTSVTHDELNYTAFVLLHGLPTYSESFSKATSSHQDPDASRQKHEDLAIQPTSVPCCKSLE